MPKIDDLIGLQMELEATKNQLNRSLDALADKVKRLLPPDDGRRHLKFKNFTKKDWRNFLKS